GRHRPALLRHRPRVPERLRLPALSRRAHVLRRPGGPCRGGAYAARARRRFGGRWLAVRPGSAPRPPCAGRRKLQRLQGTPVVTEAVIVSTARTGLAKSWRGAFNMTYGATLGAHAVRHAIERAGLEPGEVEDVIMGSTFGEGTTGGNIARAIALRAGCPPSTAGLSINRLCRPRLQAIPLPAPRGIHRGAESLGAGGAARHS